MIVIALTLGAALLVPQSVTTDPCDGAKDGYFTIRHQSGSRWKPCEARIGSQRTVRIVIEHASPFIYEYTAEGAELPADDLTGPLKQLLGLEQAQKNAENPRCSHGWAQAVFGPEQQKLDAFRDDLARLNLFRESLISLASRADEFPQAESIPEADRDKADAVINARTREQAAKALDSLPPELKVMSSPLLQRKLQVDFDALTDDDKRALESTKDAAIEALPGLIALYNGMHNYAQGPREIPLTYSGSGSVLVRVKVTHRLAALGELAARPVGLLDVGTLLSEV